MDPTIQSIIINLATSYFAAFSIPQILGFFKVVFKLRPALEARLRDAKTTHDFEQIFREAVGVIDAVAGDGSIVIDGSFLEALRGIRFDHQNGTVSIQGSILKAQVLETGGTGIGTTTITDSSLRSQGTRMNVGSGAQIKITGNAKIRQS